MYEQCVTNRYEIQFTGADSFYVCAGIFKLHVWLWLRNKNIVILFITIDLISL